MIRSSAAKVAVLLGVIAIGPSFVNPRGASVTVVISQVFGGGGSGAPSRMISWSYTTCRIRRSR